jgi:DNA polymerase
VFGEGPAAARILTVGGQPGDQEDREGYPFVGPAGRILDRAWPHLEPAGENQLKGVPDRWHLYQVAS